MRIDSSGNVGIGGAAATASGYSKYLHVQATSTGSSLHLTDGTSGHGASDGFELLSYNGTAYVIQRENSPLLLYTNDTERMRIDSTGKVGIGTSSPVSKLSIQSPSGQNALLEIAANGNTLGSTSALYGQDAVGNAYAWQRLNGPLLLGTNNTERMRIDSSGNLLVGKTSADFGSSVGFEANANDTVYATRSGGASLTLNRTSSDGDIALFRKDGTTVGSIGNDGNDFYVTGSVSNIAGVMFANSKMMPMKSGSNADGQSDLGSSSYRWKDLYLSGGVYLGGTGSANKLDDYEEGTWTNPTIDFGGGTTGITYIQRDGWYTKIGRLVTVGWEIVLLNKGTSTGNLHLGNLPFTIAPSQRQVAGDFYFQFMASSFPTGAKSFYGNPNGTNTGGVAYFNGSSGTSLSLNDTHFGNSSYWYGTFTYYVA